MHAAPQLQSRQQGILLRRQDAGDEASSTALKMAMGLKDTNDISSNEDATLQMWGETKSFENHNGEN